MSGDREEQAGSWRGEQGVRRPEISLEKGEEGGQEGADNIHKKPHIQRGVRPAPKCLSRGGGGGRASRASEEKAGRPGEPGGSRSGTHRNSREAKCSEAQRLPPECEYQGLAPLTSPQSARVRKQTRTSKLQVRKLRLEAAEQGAQGQGPVPSRLLS